MTIGYGFFSVADEQKSRGDQPPRDAHFDQGFYRHQGAVDFFSLIDAGVATVRAFFGGVAQSLEGYDRVISVPLELRTGRVYVLGPEEEGVVERVVDVEPGTYVVTAAQTAGSHHEFQHIDIFLEPRGDSTASSVLKADSELQPPDVLLEE